MERVVVAGTRPDKHGEQLSRQALETIFEQMPDERLMNFNHDLSQRPVARAFNKRLRETNDGNLEIVMDVEVLDEEAVQGMGGFSISFTSPAPLVERPGSLVTVQLLVDPHAFDTDSVAESLADYEAERFGFELLELRRKSVEHVLIHIVNFLYSVDRDVWHGFWQGVGPYILGRLTQAKPKLTAQDQTAPPTRIDVMVPCASGATVVLSLAPEAQAEDVAAIDIAEIEAMAQERTNGKLFRVAASVEPGGTYLIRFITDTAGGDHTPDESA